MQVIKRKTFAQQVNMEGFIVQQPLPASDLEQVDPFLLIHHADHDYPGDQRPREVGVEPHPHRGFSPVTFVFEGNIQHRDSRGNDAIVEAGGMQWMHAGAGIIHSERPSRELAQDGGKMEIVQVWVNTPAARKMEQPSYMAIHENNIPTIEGKDGKSKIRVYAGTLEGQTGPAKLLSPILLARLDMEAEGVISFPLNKEFNTILYLLNGKITFSDGASGRGREMLILNNDLDELSITCEADTRMIVMAGKPLNEPLSANGPFVMNNQTQILEAMRDYQMGKMGFLIEEF